MKKPLIISAAAASLALAGIAQASPSSHAEFRGYNQCVEAAQEDSNGFVSSRSYLVDTAGDTNMYYVNGTRWEDGERSTVRVECETSANGRQLLSAVVEEGRFSNARVTVDVAQN